MTYKTKSCTEPRQGKVVYKKARHNDLEYRDKGVYKKARQGKVVYKKARLEYKEAIKGIMT